MTTGDTSYDQLNMRQDAGVPHLGVVYSHGAVGGGAGAPYLDKADIYDIVEHGTGVLHHDEADFEYPAKICYAHATHLRGGRGVLNIIIISCRSCPLDVNKELRILGNVVICP